MSVSNATIYKKNKDVQRKDVYLCQPIARALVQKILSGETLFPPERRIELTVVEGEETKVVELSTNTLDTWCRRRNVIPETGETLKEVLDNARLQFRTKERERRQEAMVEEAEKAMHRTLRVRTNLPVVGMFGVIKDERGNIVRKENSQLLKVKMDTAQFVAERLNPEKYGKVEKGEHKHLVFSLADLRRQREEMQRGEGVATA